MLSRILLSWLILTLVLIYSVNLLADSIFFSGVSDEEFLNGSDIVAEGVVSKIVLSKSGMKKGECFWGVYEIAIDEIIKGDNLEPKKVVVGMTRRMPKLNVGERQLVILRKVPQEFYNYCRVSEQGIRKSDIYIDSSVKVSIYRIFKDLNLVSFVKAVRCDHSLEIFGETMFSPVSVEEQLMGVDGNDIDRCEIFIAKYNDFKSNLKSIAN